ncbi:MAG: flagellar hook-basal body protein [Anaerovoracaceae bacterium]|jgi:flagellar basal-body rod protein FlgF
MVKGMYSAAAGVFVQQKSMDSIANNISNTSTAGYKSQATLESSFGEHLTSRLSDLPRVSSKNIGPGSFITINSSQYTDFAQGHMEATERNVDMAIQGEGFFLVESDTFGTVLTRNGQFEIDGEGNLYLPGVGRVLDEGKGRISIENSGFTVDNDGVIRSGNNETAVLYIAKVDENTNLRMVGDGIFQVKETDGFKQAEKGTYRIMQGYIERSNVNMAKELTRMIACQNQYNSCTQIIKMYDKLNELTVNQIGRIG